ncbi:hypothetical protein Lfu02_78780 [Longispora fulva]|uniref:Uncharacterized protein n=2 Tax=Longispora fulva TaxID=619741 RepID=A0A8J7KFN7_9ACTN|nr:hypothetical protein [Longispora fulva]GIG63506.1 hypothetical protein Lfu02_78780 [Longispora fulva]
MLHQLKVERIVLQLKPFPHDVSDVTPRDLLACLSRIGQASSAAAPAAGRIRDALRAGRLEPRTHALSHTWWRGDYDGTGERIKP